MYHQKSDLLEQGHFNIVLKYHIPEMKKKTHNGFAPEVIAITQ